MVAKVPEWIVGDGMGEYVQFYNPTGHVMVFTTNRVEARRSHDSRDAWEVAQIAKRVYHRPYMGLMLV